MTAKRFVFMTLILAGVGGCASSQSVSKMEGQGTKKTFDASYDQVWGATVRAVQSAGLQIDERDKARGYIGAFTETSGDSWGERVAVWVKKAGERSTDVEVVSRRAGPALFVHKNWEEPILRNVGINLEEK